MEKLAKNNCNLVQFIEHYKQKYTDKCNESLLKIYGVFVDKIRQTSAFSELSKLVNSVNASNGDQFDPAMPFYDDESLIDGIY